MWNRWMDGIDGWVGVKRWVVCLCVCLFHFVNVAAVVVCARFPPSDSVRDGNLIGYYRLTVHAAYACVCACVRDRHHQGRTLFSSAGFQKYMCVRLFIPFIVLQRQTCTALPFPPIYMCVCVCHCTSGITSSFPAEYNPSPVELHIT